MDARSPHPEKAAPLPHLDLFSGIGGFALGFRWASANDAVPGEFVTQGFVERDEHCRAVLRRHWPDVYQMRDVHNVRVQTLSAMGFRPETGVGVLTAGFPCQPFSSAGRRRGGADERYLWPAIERIIRLVRPTYIVLENVEGLLAERFRTEWTAILGTLAAVGYNAEWGIIPAVSVGAPHRRNRVWILAYAAGTGPVLTQRPADWAAVTLGHTNGANGHTQRANGKGTDMQAASSACTCQFVGDPIGGGCERYARRRAGSELTHRHPRPTWAGGGWYQPYPISARLGGVEVEHAICDVAHGVSNRVGQLRALGNSIVPQIAQYLGESILRHAWNHHHDL